jgi:GGDEF domain-containing protein
MQTSLSKEMALYGWPVTFSMGVLCCSDPPASVNEMIRQADELMYSVKSKGKNAVIFSSCGHSSTPEIVDVLKKPSIELPE